MWAFRDSLGASLIVVGIPQSSSLLDRSKSVRVIFRDRGEIGWVGRIFVVLVDVGHEVGPILSISVGSGHFGGSGVTVGFSGLNRDPMAGDCGWAAMAQWAEAAWLTSGAWPAPRSPEPGTKPGFGPIPDPLEPPC